MDHLSVMYTFFWGGFIILNRAEFKLQVTNLYLFSHYRKHWKCCAALRVKLISWCVASRQK